MTKKIPAVLMLLPFLLFTLSIKVNSATVTETCSLNMDQHTLQHTFPTCPQPGDALRTDTCSVCGIAKRTAGMEKFHPEGSPSGTEATRYVCTYINMDKGVASEKCSMSDCTGTGPHGICACGQLVAVGQSHQRTYDKTGIGFTRIYQQPLRAAEVDVRKGDIIAVSASTNSSDVPVIMTLDGVVVVDSENYLGKHYVVEHDGHMTLDGYNAQFYHLSPYDTNGTKYNIPSVLGGQQFYADQLYPYAQYNDGVYMMGSDKYSKRFTRYHSRFMTHISANTIVTMECNDNSMGAIDSDARLCILDSSYNIVYSRSKSDAGAGTVVAVTVKEEGDYWILPEYYWTYIGTSSSNTEPNDMVTIRFNGLVSPAKQSQTVVVPETISKSYNATKFNLNAVVS